MIPYGNKAGNSGVIAYQPEADRISIQFIDGTIYTYTNRSAGAKAIIQMKMLAKVGKGLSTFISTIVKDSYEKKT